MQIEFFSVIRYGLLAMLLIGRPLAPAQLPAESNESEAPVKRQEPAINFDKSDFVNVKLGPMRTTYFVGEPVVLPLRLINHTKYSIGIQTNFVPVSKLKLGIRPQNELRRL